MRTLAISDIHGCLDPLRKMIEIIAPTPEDQLIFVGDYVYRGPDSKGVIDFLINIKNKYNATFLHGNHEEKFLLSHLDKTDLAHWLEAWGGGATLESYGPDGFEAVPDSHWDFVRNTQPYHETDSHIFVHANLEHDIPVAKQHSFTLIHKKFGTPLPHQSGKVMVCGHTAQKAPHLPLNLGHAINIDTDVGRGGWLTCLHVESGHYWQTNVDGETRNGELNSKTR